MATIIEAIETEAIEVDEVEEVAIKAEVNIKVKDIVVKLKEEEVTITLIISHYY